MSLHAAKLIWLKPFYDSYSSNGNPYGSAKKV